MTRVSQNRSTERLPGSASETGPLPWAVGLTCAIVLTLLCRSAFTSGLWCDELLFVHAVELGPIAGLTAPGSSHPPLLRWILAPLAGSAAPDWLWRLPSVVASILCIPIWNAIFKRMFTDRIAIGLLLLATALNTTWLNQAYQCVPYGLLVFCCSLHVLSWFRLLERPSAARLDTSAEQKRLRQIASPFSKFNESRLGSGLLFVLTGVAAAWTHFYGINLLIGDQLIWVVLVMRGRASWRQWMVTSAATCLLLLPVVPLALNYMRIEGPYTIIEIDDYPAYFFRVSANLFSITTFFGMRTRLPLYLAWYIAAGILLCWTGRNTPGSSRGDRNTPGNNTPESNAGESPRRLRPVGHARPFDRIDPVVVGVVACGAFLAGFPAMQAHGILSGKPMWERYALAGIWIHPAMMLLLIDRLVSATMAGRAAALMLCLAVIGLVVDARTSNPDYGVVAAFLQANAEPHDAFFAQDMDVWVGPNQIDRLWFNRYVALDMPIVSGPPMRRHALLEKGLPLDVVAPETRRIWVYSTQFDRTWLQSMRASGWQLDSLWQFPRNFPLALFTRTTPEEQTTKQQIGR